MKGFVYAGGGTALDRENIIGVFDLDNTSWSYLTRRFLSRAERDGRVVNAAEDLPRSFILCGDENVILTHGGDTCPAAGRPGEDIWLN